MTDETAPDFPRDAKPWHAMLREAERRDDAYHKRCDNIDKLYAGVQSRAGMSDTEYERELQVFWANLQVLMPTIYSRAPVPEVAPRFRDRKQLPRRAGDLIERALITDTEVDKTHDKLILARDDLARNAKGVVWVVPDRSPVRARSKWIARRDFRHGWGRCWDEVPWVAKASFLTKDEAADRFDGKVPEGVEFKVREEQVNDEDKDLFEAKARLWEVWHKGKNKVVWVFDGAAVISDAQEPWVQLEEFWPCPKPAYGTLKPETLTPVPDVAFYQDQLDEINQLTDRIAGLTDGLRVKGFYAAGSGDVGSAVELAMADLDNRGVMIPVSSFAALGGQSLKDAIVWLPIEQFVATLQACVETRKLLMQDVYEITGLSDIMRGATEAQETLGAQQLKAQFGSVRVKERQGEMQRLARDVFRIKAEIMAEQYDPKMLLSMAQVDDLPTKQEVQQQLQQAMQAAQQQAQQAIMGIVQQAMQQPPQGQPMPPAGATDAGCDVIPDLTQLPPEAQQQIQQIEQQAQQAIQQAQQQAQETITIDAVMELLRDQRMRPFVLDVETDSTIEPDQMAEKQNRVEFMTALGPMLAQGVAAMQQAPQLAPFIAESIRFVASGFKVPRSMDDAIDELAEGFQNYEPPPQDSGEDPQAAQMMAQAEMVKAQATAQAAQAKAQEAEGKVGLMQQQMQIDQQTAAVEGQKTQAEVEKIAAEIQKIQAEIGLKQREAQVNERAAQHDMELQDHQASLSEQKMTADNERADRQADLAETKTQADIKRGDQQAKLGEAESAAKIKAMNKPRVSK